MEAITEQRLIELGFKPKYLPEDKNGRVLDEFEYVKGRVIVQRFGSLYSVYVGTYANNLCVAPGVKTEENLIQLCRLIND